MSPTTTATLEHEAAQSEWRRAPDRQPFFSICIPQYNRTDFLIEACRSFAEQTFRDFEVCISDDRSNDGRGGDLVRYLEASGMAFRYRINSTNLRYDGNLRSAISLSEGAYVVLMGNDDRLNSPDALARLFELISQNGPIAAAISNYVELADGNVVSRMGHTGIIGSGPDVAVSLFRRYSFVSGIVLEGEGARRETTDACDGSEMYQMYLASRLVAAGGSFLSVADVLVGKDIQVPGQTVDNYRLRPRLDNPAIVERHLPMGRIYDVVARGVEPYLGPDRERRLSRIASQLYTFIYPYWTVEFRRLQSSRYVLGVLLALRPSVMTKSFPIRGLLGLMVWIQFLVMSTSALLIPISMFHRIQPLLFKLAKRGS